MDELSAAFARHVVVGEEQINRFPFILQNFQGFLGAACYQNIITGGLEERSGEILNQIEVVNDEYATSAFKQVGLSCWCGRTQIGLNDGQINMKSCSLDRKSVV